MSMPREEITAAACELATGAVNSPPTEILADACTVQAAPLAWSQEPPLGDDADAVFTVPAMPVGSGGWLDWARAHWVLVSAALLIAAVMAVLVTSDSTGGGDDVSPDTSTVTTSPTVPQAAPGMTTNMPPIPTVTVAPAMSPDERFLELARLDGSYDNVMRWGGTGHARLLCTKLETGETHLSDYERPTVYDIVDVYCPEFDPRGSNVAAANIARADAK